MANSSAWIRGAVPLSAAAIACAMALPGNGAAEAAGAGKAEVSVAAAEFVISVGDGEGSERRFVSDLVPYIPNHACFGWRIRLAAAPAVVRVREVLRLPAPPAFWSGEDDEFSTHQFSADRTTATTVEYKAPRDGWIDNEWCIVEGDPVGAHSIDVFLEERLLRHFDFEVKRLGQ